jgi:hypothetical protein
MTEYWTLGIDYGTTYTVAATHQDDRTEVLNIDGQQRFPSAVFLEGETSIVVGAAAERRGAASPERLERTPKRYLDLGQPPIALGPNLISVTSLIASTLRVVWEEALRQHEGQPPRLVIITHPAGWATRRQALLEQAASEASIPGVRLMPEPDAAALYLASERAGGVPIGYGEHVAVYDLGGGTFDAALLRRSGSGFELAGEPGGDARIGGETFDDRLYRHLGQTGLEPAVWSQLQNSEDDAWRRADWEFRRSVREAKESVSRDSTSPVYLPEPIGRELLLTRKMVEDLVRDDIATTLNILATTIADGGIAVKDLSAVYLAGGSSRMPIVAHMVRERFGRADTKGDPKQVVALGAARAAAIQIEAAKEGRSSRGKSGGVPVGASAASAGRRSSRPTWITAAAVLVALVIGTALFIVLGRSHNSAAAAHGTPASTSATPISTPSPTPTISSLTPTPTPTRTSTPTPTPTTATSNPNGLTTVSGKVTYAQTGDPYPGASVEFQNVAGGWNIHTTTNGSGHYSLNLPAGVYLALAVDLNDTGALFTVSNLSSNNVDVPPTTKVNFTESPST